MKVKVSGLRDVDRVLGQLPKAVAKRQLRQTGLDAMKPVVASMKARAPKDQGDLRDSMTAGTNLARSQKKYAGFNGGRRNPDMVVVHAGPGTHPQAVTQEFGTSFHAPQPSVTPAFDDTKHQVVDFVSNNLRDRVLQSAARLAKKGKLGSA
jgi:HK97 gp10 family phage protein